MRITKTEKSLPANLNFYLLRNGQQQKKRKRKNAEEESLKEEEAVVPDAKAAKGSKLDFKA